MSCLHPKSEKEEEEQLQAALAASCAEDQTSAIGAAAVAPDGLAEAVAPTVVSEPVPEDDGLVAASCAAAATPIVRVHGHAKAAAVSASARGIKESMESMLPRMLLRAFNADSPAKKRLKASEPMRKRHRRLEGPTGKTTST